MHAENLQYVFCFTCQKEQTIRELPSDNTAFPFLSQASATEDLGVYEQFIIEILLFIYFLLESVWALLSYNTQRQ